MNEFVNRYLDKKIILLGSGGHAGVLFDLLTQQHHTIFATASLQEKADRNPIFEHINHLSGDDAVLELDKANITLVNGLGAMPRQVQRTQLFNHFHGLDYEFLPVISSHAIVSPYAHLAEGVQIMPGAIVQAGVRIGKNSIINTGAIIEHDTIIGEHCHIAPRATLCGGVNIGNNVHIGPSACIIQTRIIEANCIISAGAIVTHNIAEDSILYGYRAEPSKRIK